MINARAHFGIDSTYNGSQRQRWRYYAVSSVCVWVSLRYECLSTHRHDIYTRPYSHIQTCGCRRISIERHTCISVPLEAGSRNSSAPWEPKLSERGGASRGDDSRSGGWSPSPLAKLLLPTTRRTDASLGDNDIVLGHLSCARMYNALRTSTTRRVA